MTKSKDLAIISFVLGIFFWIPLLNNFIGALAIFFGIKAIYNIRKNPEKYGGMTLAIIGIIFGIIPLFFSIAAGVQLLLKRF
jgi:hypothetical protein